MNDFRELAKAYKDLGFTTIPVDSLKQPTINWTKYQVRTMTNEEIDKYFGNCFGIALLTGGAGRLEAIDLDLKYDLSGDLEERLKQEIPREILEKLWVQKTTSGGYHWVYQTDIMEPNQKLANRETTAYEKHKVYMEAFNNANTRSKALKIASNHKSLVLLETRSGDSEKSGGYILIAPTKGYEKVYGKLNKLTNDERNLLIEACRSFNEFVEPVRNYKIAKYKDFDVNPFDEFNKRGDGLGLLLDAGWEIDYDGARTVRLKRPGNPDSKSSALYDKETKVFNCFSTSTQFNCNQGYTPVNIFIEIEAEGDTQLAFEKLCLLGYNKKEE